VFDHVTIRVSDLAASEAFHATVLGTLGVEPLDLVEWENDFSIVPADAEHPVTRGLRIAWLAPTRDEVHAFWQPGVDAGHRDDGAPGPRPLADDTAEQARFRFDDGSFSHVGGTPTECVHLAFAAPDDATVDAFHRTATGAGYRHDGAPGERPACHDGYYGAYVLDPDGNNGEAVNHSR
jgi:catechol 2,3-dioxygenase-like lactoylglutathione lyase family enzyme